MSRRSLVLGTFAAFCTTLALSGCGTLAGGAPANVADLIKSRPELSTLAGLIDQSGLAPALAAAGPYTVFAPSNEAFAKLPAARMKDLAANPAGLKELLSQHVVAGSLESATVSNGPVTTLAG